MFNFDDVPTIHVLKFYIDNFFIFNHWQNTNIPSCTSYTLRYTKNKVKVKIIVEQLEITSPAQGRDVSFEYHLKFWKPTIIGIPVRSLLTGLADKQSVATAKWYSNKTSLLLTD